MPAGTRIGAFQILASLGSGGMGEVYRARDTRLERDVALKILPKDTSPDRQGLVRFAQEARAASALNHPNIISIYEIGLAEGAPFIVMELIDGRTLRELIDSGTLTVKKALDLAVQIAEGLAKAHEAGILHRDLKPENIMITRDGFAKILDFGVAKLQEPTAGEKRAGAELANLNLTEVGFVVGTPAYMSPEQASGRPVDFRSDQFAAGAIFYEMLSRRRTFQRATAVQTLSAVIQEDPEPLERLNPRVPPPLRWAISRCLSKEAEDRYSSTRDLARELEQIKDNFNELGEASESLSSSGLSVPIPPERATAARATGTPTRTTSRVSDGARASATAATPAPAAAEAPARARPRRLREFLLVLALSVALFVAGALTGAWFHGRQAGAPTANWKADLLLGTMTRAMSPRVSPDGGTVAFVTLVAGAAQAAVLKPSSGDWTVLTRTRGAGSIYKVCWSRDGNKLFFDRVSDVPLGVFTIPPLGGEERLVLEDAQGPEALPDGSLLVVRRDPNRNFQIHRLWPETGKLSPVGPAVVPEAPGWSARALSDGSAAVFWGRLASGQDRARHVYRLDLVTGQAEPLSRELPLAPPLAVTADGRVLACLVTGDLYQAVAVSTDGSGVRPLFPVTGRPWYLDAGSDGSFYVDTMDNPAELLGYAAGGGVPERVAATSANLATGPVQLPDGSILLPTHVLGRRRLLAAARGTEPRLLLDAAEQAMPPVALVGDKLFAFLSGNAGKPPLIALASLSDGRIVRRLEASSGVAPQSLAASPDGRLLYYVENGTLFAIATEGGAPARKLRAASGVAVDLHTAPPSLVLQVAERDGLRLIRTDLNGTGELPLPFQSVLKLANLPLSTAAVAPDGRIAVTVSSSDSWFRGPAIVDPVTGAVERIPVAFDGDIFFPAWSRDGSLLGVGVSLRTSLWRFQVQARPN